MVEKNWYSMCETAGKSCSLRNIGASRISPHQIETRVRKIRKALWRLMNVSGIIVRKVDFVKLLSLIFDSLSGILVRIF
jgi:hypothetical protein